MAISTSKTAWFERQSTAVGLFALGMVAIAFNDAAMKLISADIALSQFVTLRSIPVLLILLALPATWRELNQVKPSAWLALVLRGLALFSAMCCYFTSLMLLPLADAIALFFMAPVIITLIASAALGEKLTIYRIAAITLGLVGTIIIAKPGYGEFNVGSILALLGAVGYASFQLLTRWLKDSAGSLAMSSVQNVVYLVIGSLVGLALWPGQFDQSSTAVKFALGSWSWQEPIIILIIIGCSFTLLFMSISAANAYRNVEASAVAPFEYMLLVAGAFLGYWWFNEVPSLMTYLGMVFIIGAGLLMLYRAHAREERSDD